MQECALFIAFSVFYRSLADDSQSNKVPRIRKLKLVRKVPSSRRLIGVEVTTKRTKAYTD